MMEAWELTAPMQMLEALTGGPDFVGNSTRDLASGQKLSGMRLAPASEWSTHLGLSEWMPDTADMPEERPAWRAGSEFWLVHNIPTRN